MGRKPAVPAKRQTFRLHHPTIKGIDTLVRSGAAPSRNALIEMLVERALRTHRRSEREARAEKAYAEAFRDATYTAEQDELTRAFAPADAEAARMIDP